MSLLLYLVNLFSLLCVLLPVPFYCLSVYFAWKGRPLLGGALALAKVLATVRVTSTLWGTVWDKPALEAGWRLFGAGHNTASAVFFSAMLVMGAVCLLLNGYVLLKRAVGPAPAAQA